jgi:hypothetical protein
MHMSREENVRPEPSLTGMLNVTDLISDFRECARAIWNQHYKLRTRMDEFDLIYAYKAIRQRILADYLSEFGCSNYSLFVSVHPDVDARFVWEERREGPQNVHWQPLEGSNLFKGKIYRLIDFFDFSERGYIDLRYALIFNEEPESTKASRLLVDVAYCEFWIRAEKHSG